MTPGSSLLALWRREWQIVTQTLGEYILPLAFFALIAVLFPLSLGANPEASQSLAPMAIWIAMLLSSLLSLDMLFRRDFEDGTLEQLLLYARPPFLAILLKMLAHWLASSLPLLLMAPLIALALQMPLQILPTAMLTLLLGGPILGLTGGIGAALTVTVRRGSGMLMGLLLLPLYSSTLVLAMIAIDAAGAGQSPQAPLLWLGALLALALTLSPFAATAALRATLFP